MTAEQARDIIAYALATVRHAQVAGHAATPDGMEILFTDGTVGHVTVTVTPGPEPGAS